MDHFTLLIQVVKNAILLSSDITYTLLMLCNYLDKQQLNSQLNDILDVISICLNSKNEKIIKGAFLLTTNIIEILEKDIDEATVCKFLNFCLSALKDDDIWQTNKIDAITTLGSIAM